MKPIQPNKLAGFFHGIDPATQNDYYTNVVHALMEKPQTKAGHQASEFSWLPHPVDIIRLKKRDPNEIVDIQIKQFNKFPPTLVTIDSTREDFLAAAFTRKYGESKIISLKFLNSGQSNTKFKLKQIGYAYLHAGYLWPNSPEFEKLFPRKAKLFRILKKEMMHEIAEYTRTQKITFMHPMGKHNDLVHGWEMSLNSVMEFQRKNLGFEKRTVNADSAYNTILDDIYKDYPDNIPDDVMDAIYDRSLGKSVFNQPF